MVREILEDEESGPEETMDHWTKGGYHKSDGPLNLSIL